MRARTCTPGRVTRAKIPTGVCGDRPAAKSPARTDGQAELEATLDCLPAGSELVGFYSYGELSPVAAGSCDLHNQTMTLTTIGVKTEACPFRTMTKVQNATSQVLMP